METLISSALIKLQNIHIWTFKFSLNKSRTSLPLAINNVMGKSHRSFKIRASFEFSLHKLDFHRHGIRTMCHNLINEVSKFGDRCCLLCYVRDSQKWNRSIQITLTSTSTEMARCSLLSTAFSARQEKDSHAICELNISLFRFVDESKSCSVKCTYPLKIKQSID